MLISNRRVNLVSVLRKVGPGLMCKELVHQTWWSRRFLGLRCDLAALPPVRRAKFNVAMAPYDGSILPGFDGELEEAGKSDYIEVLQRKWLFDAGVQTLYVAMGPDGLPAYVQWLVTARGQDILHAYQPHRYPALQEDQVILEGAYTFKRFRGAGVMADGMAQLLRIARDGGARTAFTYVAADNGPSLRGCAHVGFVPDHLRVSVRRLGYRTSTVRSIDSAASQSWSEAISSRCS
jgi:GNAT superfamily N-acetyltransferase